MVQDANGEAETRQRGHRRTVNETLSTSEVAHLLGVATGSVANWIDQNQLRAGRTPGGHRRVTTQDLLAFLQERNLPVPEELLPSRRLILVVDDEAAVAHWLVLEIQAERPDCEVLEAHDGFAAGQVVGACRPHLVLLDLRMPGMDGFEVCRRIKADPQTRHAEVIAMTAYFSAQAEKMILESGARICLTKPLELNVLLQEIERALPPIRGVGLPVGTGKGKQARGQS
jgi:excisionase family DNA binding protein